VNLERLPKLSGGIKFKGASRQAGEYFILCLDKSMESRSKQNI